MYTYKKLFTSAVVVALGIGVATSAMAEQYTLRIGAGHAGGVSLEGGSSVYTAAMQHFFQPEVIRRVNEETEHEVRFIEGYGGTIAGVDGTLEAIESGILDIGGYCTCFEMSKLFLHNFPYFVPFSTGDAEQAIHAARRVYDQNPELTDVLESSYKQKLLGLSGYDNYHLGTTMDWDEVSDLEGVKIAGAGPNLPWLEFVGAVPVQSSLPDAYLAMQTGVYDGWIMFPSAWLGFKLYEAAPRFSLIGFGAMATNVLTINNRTWEKLPEDVRAIIAEVGREYESLSGTLLNQRQKSDLASLEELGSRVTPVGDKLRTDWANALSNFPNEMATEANTRKMPGSKVIKDYIEAVELEGYSYPVAYTVD
uniref:C4-dicarboxylate TRAP transporter substrate-binding protein n=1 Tax=Marinobacterium profundum TaxID=1714300 RepID=UPI00082A733F|nr:C4-dicarboxylate TRAP transporter substrate-binding protein [Marinobacterium profundum]